MELTEEQKNNIKKDLERKKNQDNLMSDGYSIKQLQILAHIETLKRSGRYKNIRLNYKKNELPDCPEWLA